MKRLLLLALLPLTGCLHYQTKVKIGNTEFALPKDSKFDVMVATVSSSNGVQTAALYITNGVFKMNPDIIDHVTAHDTALVNAVGAVAGDITSKAIEGAVKGAK